MTENLTTKERAARARELAASLEMIEAEERVSDKDGSTSAFELETDLIEAADLLYAYAARLDAKAPTEATGLQDKIARAYGYLWHVNNSGVGFQFSPEKAAHMARRVLRDTLTHEQRGNAINMAATELFEIIRNSHHE